MQLLIYYTCNTEQAHALMLNFFFFFQAEDGIRDKLVTGVQTCALPIYADEPAQEIGPVSQIELQQNLGVPRRSEADAAPLHLFPQLDVVVDLPVPRQDDLAVRARHRHVPGGRQVEDRQSPADQTDAWRDVI